MSNPYQVNREQAQHEARAKVLWGDDPDDVIHYLRLNGFGEDEAYDVVEGFCRERAAAIRGKGVKKIIIGAVLTTLPFVAYFTFASMTAVMIRVVSVAGVFGLWGIWLLIRGITMLASPYSEAGDVSDQ